MPGDDLERDWFAEYKRTEDDRDDGQQVDHDGRGGALVGDQPVVEDVRDACSERTEDDHRPEDARAEFGPL
jgi:hypothetical protein